MDRRFPQFLGVSLEGESEGGEFESPSEVLASPIGSRGILVL